MIKNTGIVKAGFSKYLIEGFKRGIPPTVAMLSPKNTMLIKIKQNPIEYMSFEPNLGMFFGLFKIYFGSIAAPTKKATNAIRRVMAKLLKILIVDNIKNIANTKRTINGLKICDLRMVLLFRMLKKFSSG